ncbi:hypothetical protein BN1080_00914 [Planococcus massiliensis]|uniref:SLH domain-containing protein n=1 Tax=Planococcus massiliensis TaxID=1499687 RepID=A0A098EI66_9BACL|nr:S-layer homology domain-containing protein [Planococcus massiliensis]CEG21994.1 hypothetical protein BN1080_00914 [Planococcus massiliensis]
MAYQPKSYKKFVATAATATLVATAVVPAAFADEVKPAAFTDVAKQYEAAVNFVVANNIAKGLSETQFGVSAQIKRGDAAIMIANAAGLNDETAPASGFSDVPTRGVLAINSLKKAGVVNGKSATNFGFNDSITRGEAAIMLANAFDLEGNTADVKFTDVSDRYKAAVAALVANDVTNGISATQFGTSNNIKRGDFARFVYALEEYIVDPAEAAVQSVTASNGTVTATFNVAPETAPVAADFVVTRSINGGATETVTPSNFVYNESTKTVTFSVAEVAQTNAAQTVAYSVQYKDDAAKTGSFTIAAAAVPAVQAAANEATNTVTLIFNSPVDLTTAQNRANYSYDGDVTRTNDTPAFPTAVNVSTTANGPFAANQVVTLTFASGVIVEDAEAALTISNLKSLSGAAVPTTTLDITPVDIATPANPAIVSSSLTNGAQTSSSITANAGNKVELDVAAEGVVELSTVRYRLLKPDNTFTDWVSVNAEDGRYDELAETAVASIDTTGYAGGNYQVQVQVADTLGNFSSASGLTLTIVAADITAPSTTISKSEFSNTTRRVSVEGSASDLIANSNINSNVTNVQYRVQTYNATTNAFTTSTDWTNATAVDGTFNERTEEFTFASPQLTANTNYRIQVRAVDAQGNTGEPVNANPTNIGTPANQGYFTAPAGTGDVTPPTLANTTFTVGNTTVVSGTPLRTNAKNVRITGTAADTVGVSNVQYAVYRDGDSNGSYETEVQAFSSTGVTAVDGGFNSTSEEFVATYTLPNTDGNYRIVVRSTDTAGNNSEVVTRDVIVDTTAPTATLVPDTTPESTVNNDYILTFNEAVQVGTTTNTSGLLTANNVVSEFVNDPDNYTVQQGNQVVETNTIQSIAQVGPRQYRVVFTSAPTAAQTINLTGVQDIAGNAITPARFTVSQ